MIQNSEIELNRYILDGIKTGDPAVLRKIFSDHKYSICQLLMKGGASSVESDDIFMSAIEVIFNKLQNAHIELLDASFKTYLTKICLFQWSKIKRRKKFTSDVTIDDLGVLTDMEDLSEDWNAIERKNLMSRKMKLISSECRHLLEWFYSEQKSITEIATLLKIAEGNVRKRKFDCKEKLIRLVQNDPLYKELIH